MNPFKLRQKEEEHVLDLQPNKWAFKTEIPLIEKQWQESVPSYRSKEMRDVILAFEELDHRQQNEVLDRMFSYTDHNGKEWMPSRNMLSGRRQFFEAKIQGVPRGRLTVLSLQLNKFKKTGKL